MANYPVTKLVGVALKLRKLNEKFAVVRSFSQKQPGIWSFQFDVLHRTAKKCTKILKHMCKTVVIAH